MGLAGHTFISSKERAGETANSSKPSGEPPSSKKIGDEARVGLSKSPLLKLAMETKFQNNIAQSGRTRLPDAEVVPKTAGNRW